MKKLVSLLLALALCMGLALPALAEENESLMSTEEGLAPISLEVEDEDIAIVEQEETLYTYYATAGRLSQETLSDFNAIKTGAEITVSHTGSDAGSFIWLYFKGFDKRTESFTLEYIDFDEEEDYTEQVSDFKDKYLFIDYWNTYYLSNSARPTDENVTEYNSIADGTGHYWNTGEFSFWVNDDNEVEFGQDGTDALILYPGDSVTFTLPDGGSDILYQLYASIYYPQSDQIFWSWYAFKIDDELVASAPAEPEQPSESEQPSEPEQPSAPVAPAADAVLSPQKLAVDGEDIECEKYNIGGSNYFKLRDLAYLLNGTGSQFGVGFDEAAATVSITTGEAYEPAGTELAAGVDNSSTAQTSSQSILIDGEAHGELTVYNIGGSNFFQLRELGTLLNFEVDYDADTNTAIVRSVQN